MTFSCGFGLVRVGAEERAENSLAGAAALDHVADREDGGVAEERGASAEVLLELETGW